MTLPANHLGEQHYNRSRASIRQTLAWYLPKTRENPEIGLAIDPEMVALNSTLQKLDQCLIRIAAFGLVSRGKSAVLNALVGKQILPTGATNGVTQIPRSILWQPSEKIQVELIDTPGLDEIAGAARAEMARQVAEQADLILFIVAGDITRTEYLALQELRSHHKPLILVFNKIDLYPEADRQEICQQLQKLSIAIAHHTTPELIDIPATAPYPETNPPTIAILPEEIVMVAAAPAPVTVRIEAVDGSISHTLERPPIEIKELQQKILDLLNQSGRSLLALNALVQARELQNAIADKILHITTAQAEELIWRYVQYKSAAVSLNPVAVLDVLGGFITDLALIRSLAKLYGLPITSYEAAKVWRKILLSSGYLLATEIMSNLFFGMGKGVALLSEGLGGVTAYGSAAIAQGATAGYGTYLVGKATQTYLLQGCTWGELGANTIIQEIISQLQPTSIIYRLQKELQQETNQ
jgi:uncharacterized protein